MRLFSRLPVANVRKIREERLADSTNRMDYNHLVKHVNVNQSPRVAATSSATGLCLFCVNYLLQLSKLDQSATVALCAFTLPAPRDLARVRGLPCLSEAKAPRLYLFPRLPLSSRG